MSDCVSCNTAPPPCNCSADQTCVQTPRNCSTCPKNLCISSSTSASNQKSNSAGLAAPIGGAIGGLAAGLIIILSIWILYRRNLLPSYFTTIFQSKSTKSFSTKHPHHLRNQNNNKNLNNRFKSNHHLQSQSEPTSHQSVIYLPTDTRDPKTASMIESDDDPFSDKHSGVSIIGAQPKPNHSPNLELLASPVHLSPSSVYSPSRALSLTGLEDRNLSVTPHHPTSNPAEQQQQQQQQNHPNNSTIPSHPNPRLSFPTPSLPSPTHPTHNHHKPIRPHRAPDLDLRLPATAANQLESEESKPSTAERSSADSPHSHLSPLQHSRSFKRLSGSSDATTHDSHLSSILDPAMIVTPVTLVRTASGRQAAVQRVALRGQEKARVVRLPPSGHPHGPSPLSLSTGTTTTTRSQPASSRETFGFLPSTPGIGRTGRPPSGQLSPLSIHQAFDFENTGGLRKSVGDPFSDLSALGADYDDDDEEKKKQQAAMVAEEEEEEESRGERREEISGLPSESAGRKSGSNLCRARSTAYSIASSSFAGSSVCDSFIEDEEVEFPTVLGRSATTLAQRILQQRDEQLQFTHAEPPSTSHHHVNLKALGRDRAISLSSIITEEARRTSRDQSPPPLPSLPPTTTISTVGSLPEPFKPFAGQKPARASLRADPSDPSSSNARLSATSSVRSGYGSVLEGIPFNIGFCSDTDDLLFSLDNPSISASSASSSSSAPLTLGQRPVSVDETPNGIGSDAGSAAPHDEDDRQDVHPTPPVLLVPVTPTTFDISSSHLPITPSPSSTSPASSTLILPPVPTPNTRPPSTNAPTTAIMILDPDTRAALDYINQL